MADRMLDFAELVRAAEDLRAEPPRGEESKQARRKRHVRELLALIGAMLDLRAVGAVIGGAVGGPSGAAVGVVAGQVGEALDLDERTLEIAYELAQAARRAARRRHRREAELARRASER